MISLRDRDTQLVYQLYDFSTAQLIQTSAAYGIAGKVNSANELNLVIEWVPPETEHLRDSTVLAHADGAGGSPIG